MTRIILLSIFLSSLLSAQDIPDLSKSFDESQLLTKTIKGAKKSYYFATDSSFIDLKSQLIKATGKEWIEIKEKGFKDDQGNKENKKARRAMAESVSFTHPKNKNIRLTLSMFNTPAFGKVSTFLVTMAPKKQK